jgi:hypothetical protein
MAVRGDVAEELAPLAELHRDSLLSNASSLGRRAASSSRSNSLRGARVIVAGNGFDDWAHSGASVM